MTSSARTRQRVPNLLDLSVGHACSWEQLSAAFKGDHWLWGAATAYNALVVALPYTSNRTNYCMWGYASLSDSEGRYEIGLPRGNYHTRVVHADSVVEWGRAIMRLPRRPMGLVRVRPSEAALQMR